MTSTILRATARAIEPGSDQQGAFSRVTFETKRGEIVVVVDASHPDHAGLGIGIETIVVVYEVEGKTHAYLPDNAAFIAGAVARGIAAQSAPSPSAPPPRRESPEPSELATRVNGVVGLDLDEQVEAIRLAAVRAGELRSQHEHLERMRPVVRARAAEAAKAAGVKSEAAAQRAAEVSDAYLEHLSRQHDVERQLHETNAEYYYLRNAHELALRRLSFARTEMQAG